MSRKRIAVLMAGLNRGGYLRDFSRALAEEAGAADIDLCIFNAQGYADSAADAANERMENMVFELADIGSFDGYVALPSTLCGRAMTECVAGLLTAHADVPQLAVDSEYDRCSTLIFNDDYAVRELVEHLITVHGLRRFALVGGPVGNEVADHRLSVARAAVQTGGGVVRDEDVLCGRWTRSGGRECAKRLLSGGMLPEAVVCMNDDMALGLTDVLLDAGVRVPEDVCVTGFDSRTEALGRGLTTVRRPIAQAGREIIRCMMRMMATARPKPERIELRSEVVYGSSCGCAADMSRSGEYLRRLSGALYQLDRTVMRSASFSNALFGVADEREAGIVIRRYAAEWSIEELHVCVLPDFLSQEEQSDETGYPAEMLLLASRNGASDHAQGYFPTRSLVPEHALCAERPSTLVFNPLYYSSRMLGYTVMDLAFAASSMLYSVLSLLSGALLSLSQQDTIRAYARSIEEISVHDPLTGLYNRRGYRRQVALRLAAAVSGGQWFAMLSVDMDGMKHINDTYGHAAGDQAICRMANVLRCLEREGLVCVHMSGDEFCAFGTVNGPEDEERLRMLLRTSRDEQERSSPWICTLNASVGIYIGRPGATDTPEDYAKAADRRMYEEKRRHYRERVDELL